MRLDLVNINANTIIYNVMIKTTIPVYKIMQESSRLQGSRSKYIIIELFILFYKGIKNVQYILSVNGKQQVTTILTTIAKKIAMQTDVKEMQL